MPDPAGESPYRRYGSRLSAERVRYDTVVHARWMLHEAKLNQLWDEYNAIEDEEEAKHNSIIDTIFADLDTFESENERIL